MATLQKLRDKTGMLLAIVIFVALAAFILGDLLQSGGSIFRGQQMRVAEIGSEKIDYPEFQNRFDEVANVYKSNNKINNLDEEAYQQILNQTWEMMVQEKVMGKVYDNLGITVTPDELFDLVQGNNLHQIIQQLFANPETGQVDKSAIIRFLKYIQANPDAPQSEYWVNVEKQIVSSTKQTKYFTLVGKALYANSLQAKLSLDEKNKEASLRYIQQKFTDVADDKVKVTDSELKAYYEKNIKLYKQDAQRSIVYVAIDIRPSAEDDQETLRSITELKDDFQRASDNAQFVNANADNRFEDVYYLPGQLTPQLSAWAFSAQVGDLFGPYKEGDIYKIAKLNDVKPLPDSVKASHILIQAQNQNELVAAMNTIDSLRGVIEINRTTFEQAATKFSQDGGSASVGGDLGWFSRGKMVAQFEKAAFHAEKNQLVVVQTQYGVHLIKVTEQSKKNTNVQLAILDREVVPSTTTYQKLYSEASQIAAKSQDLKGLEKEIETQKLNKRSAVLGENDRTIAGLGASRQLVRAAFFNTKPGELVVGNDKSPVFELDNQYVVAALTSTAKEGTKSFEIMKPVLMSNVIKEKKADYLLEQFKNAKGSNLDETATKLGLVPDQASGFNFAYGTVNKIGYEPAINGAAMALQVNQLSNPIAGRNGVYMITLTDVTDKGNQDLAAEKSSLFNGSSYRANYQAYKTLRDNTEIVDKRSKFY